jgi:hypothetical protein
MKKFRKIKKNRMKSGAIPNFFFAPAWNLCSLFVVSVLVLTSPSPAMKAARSLSAMYGRSAAIR